MWDEDSTSEDDLLLAQSTSLQGEFRFELENGDVDGDNLELDVYLKVFASYPFSSEDVIQVTQGDWTQHIIETTRIYDVPDGVITRTYLIPDGHVREPAYWVLSDITGAWLWAFNEAQVSPGPVEARWEDGMVELEPCLGGLSCYWPWGGTSGVFISDNSVLSADTVRHESGHRWMHLAQGSYWYTPVNPVDFYECVITGHHLWEETTSLCAFTEGWGDFVAVVADGDIGDTCYDFGIDQCSSTSVDFENQGPGDGNPEGDEVEARVAGALLDWIDAEVDGNDHIDEEDNFVWTQAIDERHLAVLFYNLPVDKRFEFDVVLENNAVYYAFELPEKLYLPLLVND